jgi:hypothetical protein
MGEGAGGVRLQTPTVVIKFTLFFASNVSLWREYPSMRGGGRTISYNPYRCNKIHTFITRNSPLNSPHSPLLIKTKIQPPLPHCQYKTLILPQCKKRI